MPALIEDGHQAGGAFISLNVRQAAIAAATNKSSSAIDTASNGGAVTWLASAKRLISTQASASSWIFLDKRLQ